MTAPGPAWDADRPGQDTLEALIAGDADRELTFEAPWQARAFGVALALRDGGTVEWAEFQDRFIDAVQATDPDRMQADVEAVYYERWLETVEELLVEQGVVDAAELDRRTMEFTTGARDSSEFETG